ncbi:MAG: hypothetical protein WHS46_05215 [Desulfosoma sp.]
MKTMREVLKQGIRKGLSGFLWMAKIVVPVSYGTALLAWTGVLDTITVLLKPLMHHLGLPAIGAVPLIVGGLTSVYGGIASMSVLPFTTGEMILLANFILICHNMIQETIIQAQSGIRAWKAVLVRVSAAVATVYVLQFFIGTNPQDVPGVAFPSSVSQTFVDMNLAWALATAKLCLKIFGIIMGIMIVLEVAKARHWIHWIVKALSPLLRVMGLSQRVGVLWMTAVVFGLAYGGAVIVEEAKNASLTPRDLEMLHLSVGVNHSMVEDPMLFLPLGLPAFWLWVPRLVTAICITWCLSLGAYLLSSRARAMSRSNS